MSYNDIVSELQDMRYLSWAKVRRSSGTAGSFLKAYETVEGQRVYYKLSSYDPVNGITGHECINEIIADRLLTLLGIDHLHYRLIHAEVTVDGKDAETWLCASDDFKKPGDSKMALDDYYAMNHEDGENPLDFCKRMGWEDYCYAMLLTDFLILNRDRHGANVEVLKNRKTGVVQPAPLFDHGMSFVCRCENEGEVKAFDPMEDRTVQCFIGSRSATGNIELIPPEKRPEKRKLEKKDRQVLFDGLGDVLPQTYLNKIWDMIRMRWNYYESLQNNR